MSSPKHKRKRDLFKEEERAIRAILNEWNPIAGSPVDEYDCLAHRILSVLHRGASKQNVKSLIEKELVEHFGINEYDSDIESTSNKIWSWWEAWRQKLLSCS